MRLPKRFIWIICLGLITSCAYIPKHLNENIISTAVAKDNSSLVSPTSPQRLFQSTLFLTNREKLALFLAENYHNQGEQYHQKGLFRQALPWIEKAFKIRNEILDKKHLTTITNMGHLAIIYSKLGRLSEALPLHEKSYRLSKDVLGEKHQYTLNVLNNLAGFYKDLGRLSDAMPLFEKVYHLRKDMLGEKHPATLMSLHNLAIIYEDLGYLSKATPLLEEAYYLKKEVLGEKHPSTLISLFSLAYIHYHSGNPFLALSMSLFDTASFALEKKHPYRIAYLNNFGQFLQAIGDLDEALSFFETAYNLRKDIFGEKHPDTLLSLFNFASAYAEQGKINQAIKHLEKFVEGIENLRSGDNLSAENRQALFKKWVQGYFKLSELYISQSRDQDAFRLAEMGKARTLLESLAAKLAVQQSGLTTTEQQQLQDDEARLAFLNNQIAKALTDKRVELRITLETDKNQLVNKRNQFRQQLMTKYPKYNQLSKVQIINAQKGSQLLQKKAIFISYLVNENRVLTFTLESNGKLTTHYLGEIPNLEKDLETYRLGLAPVQDSNSSRGKIIRIGPSKRKQETQALGIKLGKHLLEPLKNIIKDKSHWIISPSGPLALIPFDTLRFEGQQVIVQHQISYVQSLSVLAMLQKRDKAYKGISNRGSLLAMGAPLYEKTTATGNPSTTDFKIARQMVIRGGDYTRALGQLNLKWDTLPGALEELLQLEKLFKSTKPRIYKQAQATEANLQTLNQEGLLAQHRYLVFSAHGYLSDEVPALSSIVLGQVNNPKGIDGYVTAGEWPGYNLKSDLMVLSACETGLGSVVSGEGVMGLPYALYVAGNKNTILTLWSISDNVTAEFITSFFAKLKAGVGQVKALTATKREFLKRGGDYSKPEYWAAFVLYGI
ncbi:CHAT domain-containing tetratricopeptide repeat protein [Candidatus Parabeggiatoa sp. HSG14]|uniref:CHAT domain-containing protein n=1 Tax=Candidatus Parabeggiatoa sp. HSG14 TaxID=3055593 RepID=UPI0025A7C88C|nr:CHAT domain-containing protein [Thiotrichales bacterium HSG14]